MSMSREEFVKMMGISDADLQKPPEPKSTTSRSRFSKMQDEDDYQPTPPKAASFAKPVTSSAPPRASSSMPPSAPPSTKPNDQAREEFLRSLGIDNMDTPVGAPAVTSSKRSAPQPAAAPPTAASTQSRNSSTGQTREEFLRSLGIDNAQPSRAPATDGAADGVRNATGSQELPRTPFQQSNHNTAGRAPPPNKANVSRILEQTDDDYEDTPRKAPLKSHSSDFTLGPKPTIQKAPENPALDAELRGMQDTAGAEERKAMGNKYFQAGDYRKAVRLYTQAIEMDGTNAALYSNRSAAYLLGGKQMGIDTRSMSLRDADKAIKLKPTWFKGYSRRGDALFKLERYDEAKEAYEKALEYDPGNTSIVHSLNELRPFTQKKAGGAGPSTWSAPGSGNLYSSVTSLTGVKKTDKSAYEMLDEFQREREHSTPHLGRGGSDYKWDQLERFRQKQSSDTSSSFQSTSNNGSPGRSYSGAAKATVPQEFSSEAAQNYQSALLESYRKKKQAQR